MAGIRLEWAQFGDFDSFDVIRSNISMANIADEDLPSPIATGLSTMYYVDITVVEDATYYYRVVAWRDGVSEVSSEIKVVAQAGDPYWSNVVSLMHFDGNLIDAVTDTTYLLSGSISYTDNSPVGTKAVSLAPGAWITLPQNVLAFGYDDFTIEFFIKLKSVAGKQYPYQMASSLYNYGGGFYIVTFGAGTGWGGAGQLVFSCAADVQDGVSLKSLTDVRDGNWHHIEINRNGLQSRLFVDGILESQQNSNAKFNLQSSSEARINTSGGYQGLHDGADATSYCEMRITKGVARHTANFTPPDAPFSNY